MFRVQNWCCNQENPEYQGQEWQDQDGPGLTLLMGDVGYFYREYGDDGDQQEEGVGEGHQVCEGAGVETGVRGTVIYLCEQQDLDREEDLDQDAEEQKEVVEYWDHGLLGENKDAQKVVDNAKWTS